MMYLGKDPVGLATSLPVFSDIAKIEFGEYTPSTDEDISTKSISHSLGEIPDFIICFAKFLDIDTTWTDAYLISGYACPANVPLFNSYSRDTLVQIFRTVPGSGLNTNSQTQSYFKSDRSTNNSFYLPYHSSITTKLKANITYYYVIGKFKEVTANV